MAVARETAGAPRGAADILALGFGTAAAMWGTAYICRLPAVMAPSPILLVLLLVCLLAGGWLAGRASGRGIRGGLYAGLLAGCVNLLILGSLLGGSSPGSIAPSALLWVPGSIAIAGLLGAAGAAVARRDGGGVREPSSWSAALVRVAVGATLLLIVVGGLVTSADAGLAVADWPGSFGYNMFLYPLSRMTGGVYYEHAHRLFGSLVGLTTLVLAVHLVAVERRSLVRALAVAALAMVVGQGILGGLRVTELSLALAAVHGVLGQLFFATLCTLAVLVSPAWIDATRVGRAGSATDRKLGVALVACIVAQLVLGALQRHFAAGLHVHVTMAAVVATLATTFGLRAVVLDREVTVLRRFGAALVGVTWLQIGLGIAAWIATAVPGVVSIPVELALATAHQGTGAVLLGVAVVLVLWSRRIVAEG